MQLVNAVYDCTSNYPSHQLYGLTSQTQRAAVSIPANIAEDHARTSTKEFLYHLSVALGSLAEVETLLIIAQQRDYLTEIEGSKMLKQCTDIGKVIRGLQRSLRARLNQ